MISSWHQMGLRTTQFSILAKLKQRGPLTINALAKDMVTHRTTLGRNVLPLERDGLIRDQLLSQCSRAMGEWKEPVLDERPDDVPATP